MDQSLFPERKTVGNMALVDPAAVAAAESAKALIQASFIMAFQKPRNQMQARSNILKACKRTEFAAKAEYCKPIGKTKITGPSVRFAELAIREWENVDISTIVLYEDDDVKRLRVMALDLETNSKFSRDIQIKKTIERKSKNGRAEDVISERKNAYGDTVYILRATDEEMLTKESAWVSKIIRNEGLRLIPTDIIEEGLNQCRQTLRSQAAMDPEGEKKKIVDAFASIGIKPVQIEKYLEHELDTITPAEITDLRSVYRTIRDGEAKWSDYTTGTGNEKQPATSSEDVDAALASRPAADPPASKKIEEPEPPAPATEQSPMKPTGNSAHNGPPEGVTIGGQPESTEPASIDWDPRENGLMQRYVADKAAAVKQVAEEMGIATDNRLPKEVHADILAACKEPDEEYDQEEKTAQPDNGGNALSLTRDSFLKTIAQHGIGEDQLDRVNECIQHHAGMGIKPLDQYREALKDTKAWVESFRAWTPPPADDDDPKPEESNPKADAGEDADDPRRILTNQALQLRGENQARWDAIAKRHMKAGRVPGTFIQQWTDEAIQAVIAEFRAVDDGGKF